MSGTKSTYYSVMPFVGALLFAASFAQPESLTMPVIFTGVLLLCIYKTGTIRLNLADILILALLVWEFVTGVFTQGRNNCISYLISQYISTAYYFILRLTLTDDVSVRKFLQSLSVFVLAIAAISTVSFSIFKDQVYGAGFVSLYDFKYLYRPLGNLNNVWGTLMLVLWGITAVYLLTYGKKGKGFIVGIMSFALVTVCLVLSFSRGIYICLLLSVLLFCGHVIFSRGRLWLKVLKCAVLPAFIIAVAAIYKDDSMRTARLVETESQRRSLEGRIDALDYTVRAVRENPALGVGTGNYSLAVNEFMYEDNNDSYTNLAPNIVSQLLVEKGIIGTVLWGLVYVVLIIRLLVGRPRDRNVRMFIFLFITVILVREMSLASMLTDSRILSAVAVLLVLFQNNIAEDSRLSSTVGRPVCAVISAAMLCGLCIIHYAFRNDSRCYRNYSATVERGDYAAAYRSLGKARDNVATNVMASSASLEMYFGSGDRKHLLQSKAHIDKAVSLSPQDAHLSAFRAVVLLYCQGTDSALAELDGLISRFPSNPSYRLLAACVLYHDGKEADSVPHLVQAIISSPSILESRRWHDFSETDPEMAAAVSAEVESRIGHKPEDPMLLSRYGKLLYLLGNAGKAGEYLSEAAALLPNLKTHGNILRKLKMAARNCSGICPCGAILRPEVIRYVVKQIQELTIAVMMLNQCTGTGIRCTARQDSG